AAAARRARAEPGPRIPEGTGGRAARVRRARRDGGHGHPRPRLRRGRRGAPHADRRRADDPTRDHGTGPVIAAATAAGPPRVTAIRSFIRGRRRRPWSDWYSTGFAVVLALIWVGDLLAQPFYRLNGAGEISEER